MSEVALAATLFGPEDLRMVAQPLDPLAKGMVRIKFGAAGICGSDMHYFRHARTGNFVVTSPLVLGHEIAGTVAEVGLQGTHLKVGDHVAINPSRWCGHCARCREGRANLCENIYFMGSASKTPHMQGGFATFFDVVPAQCIVVPKDLPFASVALAEPLAVCLHAASRAGDLKGRRVALFGAGPIGLLTMLSAKLAGAGDLTMIDIAGQPLAFARKLGANATFDISEGNDKLVAAAQEQPFDVVFEVTGAPSALAMAIRTVCRGGVLVQIGNLPGGEIPVPANAIMAKEIDFRGSFRFDKEFARAVDLIVQGGIDVQQLITARRPLADTPAAMRLALDRSQSIKVVLEASS
ncbi:L-idonate 5-dehydrogenase [Taklimakanibacter lacteus]|uniref:L-idonate 5-dehydrogenase n=1 Tax=Taklimakanibacter lacteus TaxID=2268456 RepID=UPI000E66D845